MGEKKILYNKTKFCLTYKYYSKYYGETAGNIILGFVDDYRVWSERFCTVYLFLIQCNIS